MKKGGEKSPPFAMDSKEVSYALKSTFCPIPMLCISSLSMSF